MLTHLQDEQDFAERLAKEFLDEGYQALDPALVRKELPIGYIPDLVLKRGDEVLIIEVKSQDEHRSLEQVRLLKGAIESKPNWKFKLYVAPRLEIVEKPEDNLQDLKTLIARAKQLNRSREFEAAAVVLWMALEVALRALLTSRQSRPNLGVGGMSMARSLSGFGEITEDELKLIEDAWRTRNLAVHGFRLKPRKSLSPDLIALTQRLAEQVKAEATLTS
jgi:hypothetical protein